MTRTVHALTALALLASSLAPAWAQQPVFTNPDQAASASQPPPMISRWIDAHGRVHYGDALPPDAPEQTTEVGPLQIATPEQKAQADAQLQQDRSYLQQPSAAPPEAAPETAAHAEHELPDNSCAGQWARFNAAAACTAPYHVLGGGLRGNASQHCPVVPQPACPPPGP